MSGRCVRVVAFAAATSFIAACGGDSIGSNDGSAASVVVPVAGKPGLIQATNDAIWVATSAGLTRIDPTTNGVVAEVAMEAPEYLTSDGSSVWVSLFESNTLLRIDTETNTAAESLTAPNNPGAAVVLGDDVWVTSHRGAAVLLFDRNEPDPIATITVGQSGMDGPLGLAYGFGSIWVGTPNIFAVSRIDPSTKTVTAEFGIPPGANPCGDIAIAAGRVQVSSCRVEPSVSVIDPATGDVHVVEMPGMAISVAVVDDNAWWSVQLADSAGGEGSSQLIRIDPAAWSLTAVELPGVTAVSGVVVAFDSVWVADESSNTVVRFPIAILGP